MQPNGGNQANAQRVVCPKCSANNFVGRPRCWHCQAPLLPPDALNRPAAAVPNPPGFALPTGFAEHPSLVRHPASPLRAVLLFVGIGLLTFIVVLLVALKTHPETPVAAPQATRSAPEQIAPPSGTSTPPTAAPVADPITEQARRVIDSESGRLGIIPQAGPDGRIHVRSGGSITPEEWKDATQRLQNSPLLKSSPSVPPVGP